MSDNIWDEETTGMNQNPAEAEAEEGVSPAVAARATS